MSETPAQDFRLVASGAPFPEALRGGVIAIGNFDGVHLGHRAVLEAAARIANAGQHPALALTFEPHPRSFFNADEPVFRLATLETKARLIEALGFSGLVERRFDAAFAGLRASQFIEDILLGELGAGHIVTGADFHFGHKREGTPQFLEESANRHGFGVTRIDPVRDGSGQVVSSTRIRDSLADGDIAAANALLGRAWSVSGTVLHGRKVGRTINYPTANIQLQPQTRLMFGIYAVRATLHDGRVKNAVASFGRRPTFDNGEALLEVFIFDFNEDIYDRELSVEFHAFLRGEQKFDTVEALIEQMDRDSAAAQAVLSDA